MNEQEGRNSALKRHVSEQAQSIESLTAQLSVTKVSLDVLF